MTASSKWRAAFAATAASAVLAAVPVVGAQPAHAQTYPPLPPSLTLSSTIVTQGESLGFTGTGFVEGHNPIESALFSEKVVLGHHTADETGTARGTVTIPENTRPGRHIFRLKAEDPEVILTARIRVLPDKPHLAHTGENNNSSLLLGGAAGLILLGGGAVMAARRLKRH